MKTTLAQQPELQSFQPEQTIYSSSVFIERETMYVVGGHQGRLDRSQMFSLDLSKSWSTSQDPPFKKLSGGLATLAAPGALTKDKKSWFIISNATAYSYNFAASSWKSLGEKYYITERRGLAAATDPDTGAIYVPNGYGGFLDGSNEMLVYNASSSDFLKEGLHPALMGRHFYAAAWAPTLKAMLMFGGGDYNTNNTNNDLYSYSPELGWSLLTTKGDIPSSRDSTCFVPAHEGRTMVLFGGMSDQGASLLDDVYLYDVESMTWKRGKNVGVVGGARYGHVCAVSDNYLIVWGGGSDGPISNLLMVYDIEKAEWTNHYSYKPAPVNPTDLFQPSSALSLPRSNLKAAVGVLGIVVMLVIGGF
ncbi:hypothetical protein BCR41DRAFT_391503 [Lobosporangium transversale]|uniref:Galactose oxidase n=1 Tax=Lobosporangium transversale TaxID=64571 RepID=A0A1Y2H3E7_9FUNG|nr:hypothetical protein BCR41DRAFT_391503 [Lobosporangium transversale]ORZ29088.1 hypothetical protein BCR41DRAFT_391503 [Lobosporangium transversale]|eukprot:XP_021886761.1 hypothetical protein BCR41DRAFT_391503 [Lobosporangium transversale]